LPPLDMCCESSWTCCREGPGSRGSRAGRGCASPLLHVAEMCAAAA
jgi:hypothetical protein